MKDNLSQGKKCLLIVPSSASYESEGGSIDIGLLYLASIAENCECEVRISKDLFSELKFFKPAYLLADISMQDFKSDMEQVARAKELLPNLTTIVKGVPFLTYNTNVIYENPYINYVITGEPEFALKDILESVPDNEIQGICYSENMQSVKNEERPFLEDIDSLPFPSRCFEKNLTSPVIIEVSRGAIYQEFDSVGPLMMGSKMRFRSPQNILSEIEHCIKNGAGKEFYFKTQYFNYQRDWAIEFCQILIDSNIKIKWESKVDIRSLDEDLINLMAKAGCEGLNLSIPSGSVDILKNIGLTFDFEKLVSIKPLFKKLGIKLYNNFILGYPWETEESIQETLSLAIKLGLHCCDFKFATPYPGSRHFAYAMMNKLFGGEIKFDNLIAEPVVRAHSLSKDNIVKAQKLCVRKFYLRFEKFFSLLCETKNFASLKRILSFYSLLIRGK